MIKNFFQNENGETNIISILIIVVVIVIIAALFMPYAKSWLADILK